MDENIEDHDDDSYGEDDSGDNANHHARDCCETDRLCEGNRESCANNSRYCQVNGKYICTTGEMWSRDGEHYEEDNFRSQD